MPGAITSGLKRLSFVGPRLLKATTSSGLSAIGSALNGATGKSLRPPFAVRVGVEVGPVVLARADGDAVLRGPRRADAHRIDLPVAVRVGAVVAGRDHDAEVLVLADELVELPALVVVGAGVAAAPGVRVDPGALARTRPRTGRSGRRGCRRAGTARTAAGRPGSSTCISCSTAWNASSRLVREPADRPVEPGETGRRRAARRAPSPEVCVPWPLSRSAGPSLPPGLVTYCAKSAVIG